MFACLFLFVHDCTIARPLLRVYYIPFCAPILQLPQLGQAPALAVLLYYDCATLMCTEVTVMMRKKGMYSSLAGNFPRAIHRYRVKRIP